jgi:hypothetical protein
MKVGKPGNQKYIKSITADVFEKYDDHVITRQQALDILTSWQIVLDEKDKYVQFKLPEDVFGEYDGNDPVGKWKHISESIEENYVSPDVVRHDDVAFSSKFSKILEKVEEKAKLALSDEDARIKEEKRLCQEFNAKEKE